MSTGTEGNILAEGILFRSHTPGPWEIDNRVSAPSRSFAIVAGIYIVADTTVMSNAESNARLIAAAPELLEACKAISTMDCLWSASGHHQPDCQCAVGQAERAVAKAEGRA